jgi:hypothetical protein
MSFLFRFSFKVVSFSYQILSLVAKLFFFKLVFAFLHRISLCRSLLVVSCSLICLFFVAVCIVLVFTCLFICCFFLILFQLFFSVVFTYRSCSLFASLFQNRSCASLHLFSLSVLHLFVPVAKLCEILDTTLFKTDLLCTVLSSKRAHCLNL